MVIPGTGTLRDIAVKPRDWLVVLYERCHPELNADILDNYVFKVREELKRNGVVVSTQAVGKIETTSDMAHVFDCASYLNEMKRTDKLPILFVIDDSITGDEVLEKMGESPAMYIFTASGEEVYTMHYRRNFDDLMFLGWCNEFATNVQNLEGELDFDVELLRKGVHIIQEDWLETSGIMYAGKAIAPERRVAPAVLPKNNFGHRLEDSSNGNFMQENSTRPQTYNVHGASYENPIPSQQSYREDCTSDYNSQIHSNDLLMENVPSTNESPYEGKSDDDESEEGVAPTEDIPIPITKIWMALKCPVQITICDIASSRLFNRMRRPFSDFLHNLDMLELVYRLCNIEGCCQREIMLTVKKTLIQIGETRYFQRLCHEFGQDMVHSNGDAFDTEEFYCFLKRIMGLFLIAKEFLSSPECEILGDAWHSYTDMLNLLPNNFWNRVPSECNRWLYDSMNSIYGNPDNREVRDEAPIDLNGRVSEHSHSVDMNITRATNGIQSQERQVPAQPSPSSGSLNRYIDSKLNEPIWKSCENKPPPSSFRLLASVPRFGDIVRPNVPYLRRALDFGAYQNSEHYLDVQFRLFREDLISPMRDGLAAHHFTGTSRYSRNEAPEGEMLSDLALLDIVSLGGLQVKAITGEKMRFATLSRSVYQTSIVNRHLKQGQIVMLSRDGFINDITLAAVCDRRESELMCRGTIGLSFDSDVDDSLLKKGASYVVAEASSYLEAYVHVLETMKNLNPFIPLPMERYIVYAKKNPRRPFYIRLTDSAEDIKEDAEVIAHYELKRAKEAALRIRRGEGQINDEINNKFSLEGPILQERINRADNTALQSVQIRGQLYQIDRLYEDFLPDYLDESQRKALISALTREMTLIQGPPGTGKTYVGVEIVMTLLENRCRFGITEPILLVCYTNSALDQFLEKIVTRVTSDENVNASEHHFGPLAVRLGTKTDSNFIIREGLLRNEVVKNYKEFAAVEASNLSQAMTDRRKAGGLLAAMGFVASTGNRCMLSYDCISRVMSAYHVAEFRDWALVHEDSNGAPLCMDEALGCWLLDKTFSSEKRVANKETSIAEDESEDEAGPSTNSAPPKSRPNALDIEFPLEDELVLDELFRKMNIDSMHANMEQVVEDLYETGIWECGASNTAAIKGMKLFGCPQKSANAWRHSKNYVTRRIDGTIVNAVQDIEEQILGVKPLTEEEHSNIRRLFDLPKHRRWQLYAFWRNTISSGIRGRLPGEIKSYQKICNKVSEAYRDLDQKILSKSLIIGATTTGAAKHRKMLEDIGCKILVVEEAGEVLEQHTLSAMLPSLQHAIFIGDHQQLRPNPAVYELARHYHMEISLFERLISNGVPFDTLTKQHRMHPLITETIVRPHFYQHLEDAENVKLYPDVQGMSKNTFYWTHSVPELISNDSQSYMNHHEIKMVVALVGYLFKQQVYSKRDITIIAMYSAQVDLLRQSIGAAFGMGEDNRSEVPVETVDSFQGRENKILIVSTVRSQGETIGFLSVPNRITVGLTRAQHGMYIVGNLPHLANRSPLWSGIQLSLQNADCSNFALELKCREHGKITHIVSPEEFQTKAPDGGCSQPCGKRLPCGHECDRKCHPVDDHEYAKCKNPCERGCSNSKFRHQCPKLCHEVCDSCTVLIDVRLPFCDHETQVECSLANVLYTVSCPKRCEKILSCHHQCAKGCGTPCTTDEECQELVTVKYRPCKHEAHVPCCEVSKRTICETPCEKTLPCGHSCAKKCGEDCTMYCMVLEDRDLPCGHRVAVPCSVATVDHKCQFVMNKHFEECLHNCVLPCHLTSDPNNCNLTCMQVLPCGHTCTSRCGTCKTSGHTCLSMCRKMKPCGHVCVKRCGVPCEEGECGASCLTSCKHQRCGNGTDHEETYKRKCGEPCVLCNRSCDNTCEHRSCSRRCYEACDVKPCDQGCSKHLACGHACLGMCGEPCPNMCGLCQKNAYVKLTRLGGNEKVRIVRLIQLSCGHIYPVEVLDEHIANCKKENQWPYCPDSDGRCRSAIEGVMRYAKVFKKLVLDRCQTKMVAPVPRDAKLLMGAMSRGTLTMSLNVQKRITNVHKLFPQSRAISELLKFASQTIMEYRDNDKLESLTFWKHTYQCLKATQAIFLEIVAKPLPRIIRGPPEIAQLCYTLLKAYDGNMQSCLVSSIDDCTNFLMKNYDCEMSGVLVPKARRLLYTAAVFCQVQYLVMRIQRENDDLFDEERSALITRAGAVLNGHDADYSVNYTNFVEYITGTIYSLRGIKSECNLDLILPEY